MAAYAGALGQWGPSDRQEHLLWVYAGRVPPDTVDLMDASSNSGVLLA
jgi:hypothetical protein